MEIPACFAPGGTQNTVRSRCPSCHWEVAPACGDLSGRSWQGLQMSAWTSAGFPRIKGSRFPSVNPSAGSPVRRGEEPPQQGAGGLRGWWAPPHCREAMTAPLCPQCQFGREKGEGEPLERRVGEELKNCYLCSWGQDFPGGPVVESACQ